MEGQNGRIDLRRQQKQNDVPGLAKLVRALLPPPAYRPPTDVPPTDYVSPANAQPNAHRQLAKAATIFWTELQTAQAPRRPSRSHIPHSPLQRLNPLSQSRGSRLAPTRIRNPLSSSKATGNTTTTVTMSFGGQTPTIIVLKEGESCPTAMPPRCFVTLPP